VSQKRTNWKLFFLQLMIDAAQSTWPQKHTRNRRVDEFSARHEVTVAVLVGAEAGEKSFRWYGDLGVVVRSWIHQEAFNLWLTKLASPVRVKKVKSLLCEITLRFDWRLLRECVGSTHE
jgi:hypothetical protein